MALFDTLVPPEDGAVDAIPGSMPPELRRPIGAPIGAHAPARGPALPGAPHGSLR